MTFLNLVNMKVNEFTSKNNVSSHPSLHLDLPSPISIYGESLPVRHANIWRDEPAQTKAKQANYRCKISNKNQTPVYRREEGKGHMQFLIFKRNV